MVSGIQRGPRNVAIGIIKGCVGTRSLLGDRVLRLSTSEEPFAIDSHDNNSGAGGACTTRRRNCCVLQAVTIDSDGVQDGAKKRWFLSLWPTLGFRQLSSMIGDNDSL